MIDDLPVSLLTTEELQIAGQRLQEIASGAFPADQGIQRLARLIKTDLETLETVLNRERGSEYTARLKAGDEKRDHAFLGLRDYIRAHTHSDDPALAATAAKLAALLRKQGYTLYNRGYLDQSAGLELLFGDLDQESAGLAALGAAAWYSRLKRDQAAFRAVWNEKLTSESREDWPRRREAEQALGRHLGSLLGTLEVIGETDAAALAGSLGEINSLIGEINTRVRTRRTRDRKEEA